MNTQNKAIQGFHHITAMAGDAAANIHFYTHVLGLRMVKVTVNFDDPSVYHLYYGDQQGSPGSIITFFPWGANAPAGNRDAGGITAFTLRIPQGTRLAWEERLNANRIPFTNVARPEGLALEFYDESGHKLRLWESGAPLDSAKVVVDSPVPAEEQIVELAGVEFTVTNATGTKALLETMGLKATGGHRYGFEGGTAQHIDVLEKADIARQRFGSSSVHHLAFQVADDAEEAYWQTALTNAGQAVTEVKNRNYFRSVYMREPGGIILELATLEPGFAVDEAESELGTHLKLPQEYEQHRTLITQHLPPLPMVEYGVGENNAEGVQSHA